MKAARIVRREVPPGSVLPTNCHPALRRVYAARGITDPSQLDYRLAAMLPPAFGGIERACDIVEDALRNARRIVIVGDFDCDGATGTAVAVRGLRLLGAAHVGYGVPNRATHGYGLSPALVDDLLAQRPELFITVDNGIAAHAGIDAAHRYGIGVVVTDHHLPGATLPDADAIINPNAIATSASASASLRHLAGVGVMFYFLLALRTRLRSSGWFTESSRPEPDLSPLLDLVALGTVADLVPLDYNNRILVEAGLRRIRAGQACAGITALLASGGRESAKAIASDLGFCIAPRINAAGRLDDIRLGIECLLSDDPTMARVSADALSAINAQRRDLQAGMIEQAEAAVQKWIMQHGAQALPVGLVLYEPEWHHGVVGLVASRLKETLNRPVIACAPGGEGSSELKGSGRSVAGFHLRDALAEIEASLPGLMGRFGGHAMAAGLSLGKANLEVFAAAFDAVARRHLAAEQLDAVIWSDGELGAAEFTLDLANALRWAGPWGQTFPEPLFDGEFEVERWRVVGESHLRLHLRCAGRAEPLEAIGFDAFRGAPPPRRIRTAYQLEIDEWSGVPKLRLLLRHLCAVA